MIGYSVAALQIETEAGELLPGTEEQFESALRPATVGRLSLSTTVRAELTLPYALEVRVTEPAEQPDAPLRPRELSVLVRNAPDAPVPYLRFAISGVTPAHRLPTADGDVTVELRPGEYFVELRRGSSWEEIGHPVPLNRVTYFGERQAAGRV